MLIQEPVQAAIWHCLDHYDYFDAIFLAERLNAEVESDDSTFLLATCYYRAGKPNQAYSLLRRKGCSTPQCKFLLAKCCLEFENLSEAETILRGSSSGDEEVYSEQLNIDNIVTEYGEHAVFVLRLLSEICYQTERDKVANELNRNILKLNPFIWSSFEMLCNRAELSPIPPTAAPNSNPLQTPLNTPLSTNTPPNSNTGAPTVDTKPSSKQPPGIPPSLDPAKLFDIDQLENFNYCQSSANSLLNYYPPVASALISNGLQSPQHIDSNCESIGTPLINCTPVQLMNAMNTAHNISSGGITGLNKQFTPDDTAQYKPMPPRVGKQYRTRSGLGAVMSPLNASFGILPLDSSNSFSDTPPLLPYSTPSPLIINSSTLTDANEQKPIVKRQMISKRSSTNPLAGHQTSPQSPLPLPPLPLQGSQNTVRRSSRLFTISNNNYSVKENNKSPNRNNKFATPKSPSKKTKSKLSKNSSTGKQVSDLTNEKGGNMLGGGDREGEGRGGSVLSGMTREQLLTVQKHVAGGLLELLKDLGRAFYFFSQYECDSCISVLKTLPEHHLNTGYCLTLMAKAYYESSRYKEAIKCFAKVRELEPKRTQGLELYSTALWQQQQEVELSALAQDMNRIDQFCPQTWCVNGNCFSAQKEHDTAIKYFQRATQVDPSFAYAYTLLGHEYVLTEELDKAMNCYRHAVRIDPRHYNAWYGIGSIYSKQERFLLAEMHFRKALRINPNSSVLMCHIGVAQNALGKIDAALHTFNLALEKDPKNPLCKFHRASILFGTGRHQEALEELEQLKHIVPKESLVYYLAGKVHKKLGNTHLALMHFSWATDLDPKGANSQIKEAIDPAMNRSATASDVHQEEERGENGPGAGSADPDTIFYSSSPHSSSRGAGSGTSNTGGTPSTPHNNNNNVSSAGSNSGLAVVSRSDYRELDDDDELSSTGRVREIDDELDEDEDISGTDVLHSSSRDMTLGDSDDTL